MNKQLAKAITDAIDAALKPVAQKFNLDMLVKGGTFDANGGTFKPRLEFREKDSDERTFKRYATILGLSPDDFGRTFSHGAHTYRIIGLRVTGSRKPLLTERVGSTSQFWFSVDVVKPATSPAQRGQLQEVDL